MNSALAFLAIFALILIAFIVGSIRAMYDTRARRTYRSIKRKYGRKHANAYKRRMKDLNAWT